MANMQKERIIQNLRKRGCRITRQRRMLLDIILEEDCSSCKEIFYKASRRDKSIGTATVYRMVNTLEEIGAISRKNMYRIACGKECAVEDACVIVLDDNTTLELSAEKWHEVIQRGLEECGHLQEGQKIQSVMARNCSCEEQPVQSQQKTMNPKREILSQ